MHTPITIENLQELKTKLRAKFPQLSEADLDSNYDMVEGMLRMVEYKLRKTKSQMRKIIEAL